MYLALLLVHEESYTHAVPLFRKLLIKLHEAAWSLSVKRHGWCMTGMVVSGLLTFGAGAVASWVTAGGFMIFDFLAEKQAFQSQQKLRQKFKILDKIQEYL